MFIFKNKKTFALGGVNNQNYSKLKNKYLDGFGGITNFIDKENFNDYNAFSRKKWQKYWSDKNSMNQI